MNIQTQAFIYGFIAMIGFGLETAVIKKYVEKLGPIRLIVYRNILIVFFVFLSLIFLNKTVNPDLYYILQGIGISVASYGGIYFFQKALKVRKVGLVTPLVGTRGLLAAFIGIVFFKDNLSMMQILSILIVFTGIILSTINFKDLINSDILNIKSGIPFAVLAT
ncbi:MAG: DMT family transporter, partial [Nitrososphaeraceae archaeon]|nr:DMT family transporter [Nitrososphaeraceae archaeon]